MWIGGKTVVYPVLGLGIGRIDDTGYVAGRTQDKPAFAAEKLRGLVARCPRHYMVVYSRQHVTVDVDKARIETFAVDFKFTSGKFVAQRACAQILRMHPGRHTGRVFVPGQQVERRWLVSLQPIVRHVLEDQVV